MVRVLQGEESPNTLCENFPRGCAEPVLANDRVLIAETETGVACQCQCVFCDRKEGTSSIGRSDVPSNGTASCSGSDTSTISQIVCDAAVSQCETYSNVSFHRACPEPVLTNQRSFIRKCHLHRKEDHNTHLVDVHRLDQPPRMLPAASGRQPWHSHDQRDAHAKLPVGTLLPLGVLAPAQTKHDTTRHDTTRHETRRDDTTRHNSAPQRSAAQRSAGRMKAGQGRAVR
eukprot:COSAG06_NODE_4440_length_4264_cov_932.251621_5_plen_229_part_00